MGMAICGWLVPLQAHAADVGGYLADQQKAHAMAAEKAASDGCPQLIARAASDASSLALPRRAVLPAGRNPRRGRRQGLANTLVENAGFMPAHRLLRNLQIAEAGMHGSTAHCHALGEGQQLCHGGSGPPSLAKAATQ